MRHTHTHTRTYWSHINFRCAELTINKQLPHRQERSDLENLAGWISRATKNSQSGHKTAKRHSPERLFPIVPKSCKLRCRPREHHNRHLHHWRNNAERESRRNTIPKRYWSGKSKIFQTGHFQLQNEQAEFQICQIPLSSLPRVTSRKFSTPSLLPAISMRKNTRILATFRRNLFMI